MPVKVWTDGGASPNPGPAAWAAVIEGALPYDAQGTRELWEYIGHNTNNVAEYRGLIGALKYLLACEYTGPIEVFMDSTLVIEQVSGGWRVHEPSLIQYRDEAQALLKPFESWKLTFIPRAQNKRADRLCDRTIAKHKVKTRVQ